MAVQEFSLTLNEAQQRQLQEAVSYGRSNPYARVDATEFLDDLNFQLLRSLTNRLEYKERTNWHRNWTMHNLVGHPLGEIAHLVKLEKLAGWLHDVTQPEHVES